MRPEVARQNVPADGRQHAAARLSIRQPPRRGCIPSVTNPIERMGMKKLIFIGALLFAATGVQAQGTGSSPNGHPVQAYTTLGPARAGVYRNDTQRDSYSATDNVKPNTAPSARAIRDTERDRART